MAPLFVMPEIIKISAEAELIVFGLLMMLVAVAWPDGVAGALRSVSGRWPKRTSPGSQT